MCGIAGVWDRSGRPVQPALLEEMARRLRHRGPDASGIHADGALGLAHTRLAIIDLSEAGRQPMTDAAGELWLTYNGEIYNFPQLRRDLEADGATFRSRTDTEVLLELYRRDGIDMLSQLDGMFAFALWDAPRRRMLLARDRVGKKPLYYRLTDDRLTFGSELKAVLADDAVPRELRPEALASFMTFGFVPDPETIFRGVDKLLPGHCLIVEDGRAEEREYWDLQFTDGGPTDEREAAEALQSQLRDAVRRRRLSDVPLGAFLSGGIDSGAIVAMMATDGDEPVVTTSIGFEEEAFNELEGARVVAKMHGTDHHEDVVRYDRFEEILDTLLWHFEEPFCDESAIATYYLSRLTRQHVTVSLSGDGGDEAFAGYRKYGRLMHERQVGRRLPGGLLASLLLPLLRGGAGRLAGPQAARLANFVESTAADRAFSLFLANAHLRPHEAAGLFGPALRAAVDEGHPRARIDAYTRRTAGLDDLSAALYVDTKFLLPGDFLVKVDRMSMAHSLEVRCPFLDHHLLEFAATLPADLKLRDGEQKYVLKKALEDLLPDETLYRPKHGFEVPLVEWFAGELRPMIARELVESPGVIAEWFDPAYVRRLWDEFLGGRRGHKALLWNLLMFKLWHRRWIENVG